jgi:Uma2 family endonuclease
MGQVGILSEDDRVELIDGEVVAMSPIGSRHNACVDSINRAMVMGVGDAAIVRIQGSVRLNLYTEPEPDLVLLRPQEDFYASRLPGAADILLIVEIAEASIDYERDVKSRIYAGSGVPEYWVADLNANLVSCYSAPHEGAYRSRQQYHRGQTITPQLLPQCAVAVEVLLRE